MAESHGLSVHPLVRISVSDYLSVCDASQDLTVEAGGQQAQPCEGHTGDPLSLLRDLEGREDSRRANPVKRHKRKLKFSDCGVPRLTPDKRESSLQINWISSKTFGGPEYTGTFSINFHSNLFIQRAQSFSHCMYRPTKYLDVGMT